MTSGEFRAAFVDFFLQRGHVNIASVSLIPDAMSTALFTISRMEPFVRDC
jgi:alanyl-tRNA synthetase